MFCPICNENHSEGHTPCSSRKGDADRKIERLEPMLAEARHPTRASRRRGPARARSKSLDLVTVAETGNPSLMAVAESLLIQRGIPYQKQRTPSLGISSGHRRDPGRQPVVGPVALQVPRSFEALARSALDPDSLSGGPVEQVV